MPRAGEGVAVTTKAAGEHVVVEDRGDRTGEIGGIARGVQDARLLAVEQLRKRPVVRGHHRHASREGLDRGEALRLGAGRRQGEDVDRSEEIELRSPINLAEPAKPVGNAEVEGKLLAHGEVLAFGVDRRTSRDHLHIVLRHHERQRPHELVEALFRTAAGDEANDEPATADPPPGVEVGRLGGKRGEINAVGNHRHAFGRHREPPAHELRVETIEGHEPIDVGRPLAEQIAEALAVRLGNRVDEHVLAREAADDAGAGGRADRPDEPEEQHV